MPLLSLQLKNFRKFQQTSLEFHPRRNLIYGDNAAGKSSILEAIQFLSTGKSTRSKNQEKLVRAGAQSFQIVGVVHQNGVNHRFSVQYNDRQRNVVIDGVVGGKSHETARLLPASLISPESHHDFQREPKQRRAAIDWVLFHVEQNYQALWARYQRVLQQRNAELKRTTNQRVVAAWNEELAMHGDSIHEQRNHVLQKINPIFGEFCAKLLPDIGNFEIKLKSGWDSDLGMANCLIRDFDLDKRHGFTHSGPHRSDISLITEGISDPSEFSHGQRKLLFIALKLSQASFLYKSCSLECTLLVDDLSAELDKKSHEVVISLLSDFPGQIILTSLDPRVWLKNWQNPRSFHVKHGQVLSPQTN